MPEEMQCSHPADHEDQNPVFDNPFNDPSLLVWYGGRLARLCGGGDGVKRGVNRGVNRRVNRGVNRGANRGVEVCGERLTRIQADR